MVGAAISTLAAYVVLFLGMTLTRSASTRSPTSGAASRRAVGAAVALTVAARAAHLSPCRRSLLVCAYPLALALLGFYLPAERARLRRLVPIG